MAYSVSDTFKDLANQINKEPMIVLEIEGSQYLYGSAPILETARWDDPRIDWDNDIGVTWDGEIEKANSKPYIITKGGQTTKKISQQLLVDKGGSGSVSTMNIDLVDYRGEVARDLSFNQIGEPLGKRATIYVGMKGGLFPQDFVEVIKGYVDDLKYKAGSISVSVALATNLIRQSSYEKYVSSITSNIKFKSVQIQDLTYTQIGDIYGSTYQVEYVNGGALAVNRSGSNVTVTIVNGVTTAEEIADAIDNSSDIKRFLEVEITGNPVTVQVAVTLTIMETDTVIPVVTSEPYLESQDLLTSYIRIGDEIMLVDSRTPTSFTVTRGQLGTIATAHDVDEEVSSYYFLDGPPIEMALKLLHSKEGNAFKSTGYNISALLRVSSTETIERAIIVDNYDISAKLGFVPGDLINLVGTTSNDGIKTIESTGVLDTGKSYIVVAETLTEETGLTVDLAVKSKYNTLPDGAGLDLDFVDTIGFEEVASLFSASFIDYSFKLTETIDNTRDFIIKEIMRPMGLYMIPRKAKTSCKFTAPPFSASEIPTLNTENIYDITKLEMQRSTHKYLINTVIYRYNPGILDGKFYDKLIKYDFDSFADIGVGRKRYEMDSTGLVRGSETVQTLERIGTRVLARYSNGSRYVKNVKVLFNVGVLVEIGDIIFFGGEDTKLVNLETGERDLPATQYEVINRDLDIIKGGCTLELLETGFGVDGIYAVFSPSSLVAAGSTDTKILLDRLWDTSQFSEERNKWSRWVGAKVRVRSDDYTFDETRILESFDTVTNNGLILDAPLSMAPTTGYIVEIAEFPEYDGSAEIDDVLKLTYCFTMPSALITGVTNDSTFDVDAADIGKFSVGMEVQVHAEDYSLDSETRIIDDITVNTITLDSDLNITPAIGHRLEAYSFESDKGYRII